MAEAEGRQPAVRGRSSWDYLTDGQNDFLLAHDHGMLFIQEFERNGEGNADEGNAYRQKCQFAPTHVFPASGAATRSIAPQPHQHDDRQSECSPGIGAHYLMSQPMQKVSIHHRSAVIAGMDIFQV